MGGRLQGGGEGAKQRRELGEKGKWSQRGSSPGLEAAHGALVPARAGVGLSSLLPSAAHPSSPSCPRCLMGTVRVQRSRAVSLLVCRRVSPPAQPRCHCGAEGHVCMGCFRPAAQPGPAVLVLQRVLQQAQGQRCHLVCTQHPARCTAAPGPSALGKPFLGSPCGACPLEGTAPGAEPALGRSLESVAAAFWIIIV